MENDTALWAADAARKETIERIRLLIQDRYNHASLNDKPEVAAAMKELLERIERV